MFLPIGDTPNPENYRPWVNHLLISINVSLYLFVALPASLAAPDINSAEFFEYMGYLSKLVGQQFSPEMVADVTSAYDIYVFKHGFRPSEPALSSLVYSMFLHGGFGHLAGNMLFLWIYGDNVEHRLGHKRYFVLYLVWGVVATLSYGLFTSNGDAPLVGASGAISGVLGYYFLLFPRNQVKVFVFFFPFIMNVVLVPARIVLGFYLILENVVPALIGSASSVAYGAHIGGFLAGLAFALPATKKLFQSSSKSKGSRETAEPIHLSLSRLRNTLRFEHGPDILQALKTCTAEDIDRLQAHEIPRLADVMFRQGYMEPAVTLLKRALVRFEHHRGDDVVRLYLALAVIRKEQGLSASARQHVLDALERGPSESLSSQIRSFLDEMDTAEQKN